MHQAILASCHDGGSWDPHSHSEHLAVFVAPTSVQPTDTTDARLMFHVERHRPLSQYDNSTRHQPPSPGLRRAGVSSGEPTRTQPLPAGPASLGALSVAVSIRPRRFTWNIAGGVASLADAPDQPHQRFMGAEFSGNALEETTWAPPSGFTPPFGR